MRSNRTGSASDKVELRTTIDPTEHPMHLLDAVLARMKLGQPARRFLREVLMLLIIVPGRATFRNLSR